MSPEELMRRFIPILREIAERLEQEIAALTADLDTKSGSLEQTKYNTANVARIRQRVAEVAEEVGANQVTAILRQELPDVIKAVLAQNEMPLEFTADVQQDLMRIMRGMELEVTQAIVQGTSGEVASAVRSAVTGGMDYAGLRAKVAGALDTSLGRAATGLDRAVREMGDRALIEAGKQAPGGEWVYLYEGPKDGANRPYCAARVGRYMTADQADALDPRERFGCRHVPVPIPLEIAQQDGYQPFSG